MSKEDLEIFGTDKKEPEPEKQTFEKFMSELEARLTKIQTAINEKRSADVSIDLRHIVYMFNMSDIASELVEDVKALHRPTSGLSFRVPPPCEGPCVYCANIARWENVIEVIENQPMKKPE